MLTIIQSIKNVKIRLFITLHVDLYPDGIHAFTARIRALLCVLKFTFHVHRYHTTKTITKEAVRGAGDLLTDISDHSTLEQFTTLTMGIPTA